ncbi:MAG TPA: SMP-30/gluconolactonase/LRE family protein [Thermoanaerobaculia bacterium]|nr:SMP-30/gluconolactonase/LRE family protein [Thermoanaerobaculia bacterium]
MARRIAVLAVLILAQSLASAGHASGQEGWGLVVDPKGTVAFTDVPEGAVWRIRPGGEPEKIALDKHTRALVLGSDGHLYGTEPAPEAAVWRIDPEGSLSYVVPPSTNLAMDLQAFTVDSQGALYSTSEGSGTVLLQKRRPDGKVETLAGGGRGHADGQGSAARFAGIDGMAWGPGGLLYVADGPYVRTVAPDGTVKTLGKGPLTEPAWEEDLLGVSVAPDGTVYAADYGGRRLLRMDASGQARTVLQGGRYWAPTGVAVAGEDIYVLEQPRKPLAALADAGIGPYLRVLRVMPGREPAVLVRLWGRNTVAAAAGTAAVLVILVLLWRRRRRSRYGGSRRLRL